MWYLRSLTFTGITVPTMPFDSCRSYKRPGRWWDGFGCLMVCVCSGGGSLLVQLRGQSAVVWSDTVACLSKHPISDILREREIEIAWKPFAPHAPALLIPSLCFMQAITFSVCEVAQELTACLRASLHFHIHKFYIYSLFHTFFYVSVSLHICRIKHLPRIYLPNT